MKEDLFGEHHRRDRYTGSLALVHVPTDSSCPRCGQPTHDETFWEPALLRHGGYGATRRTITRTCTGDCPWSVTVEVTEERPAPAACNISDPV